MMNFIIENYINNLTFIEFEKIVLKHDVNLSNENLNYFYQILKTNWRDILKRPNYYLEIIKNKVDAKNYQKIYNLYLNYNSYLYR